MRHIFKEKILKRNEKVKELPDELRTEYEYVSSNTPDIPDIVHPLINISDTLKAYYILAHYFTDNSSNDVEKMLIGVRDTNLLGSAIGRQVITFGGKTKYTDNIEICATLFFGIVKNHSFSDGNKRTALLILLYQLHLFGYMPATSQKNFEKLVVAVAANRIPETYFNEYKKNLKKSDPLISTIAHIIRKNVKKKDHSYHIAPTMREFCDGLSKHDVEFVIDGNKIHFKRRVKSHWYTKAELLQCSAMFYGWTRVIGADTARKTLRFLKLYDEFASYKDFIEGKEAMYQLVHEFSGPLRRLKDK